MRTTQAALLAAAAMVAGAGAFVPPTLLPKARAAAVRQRSTLRMDAGEDVSKLAKIEQLKVCWWWWRERGRELVYSST